VESHGTVRGDNLLDWLRDNMGFCVGWRCTENLWKVVLLMMVEMLIFNRLLDSKMSWNFLMLRVTEDGWCMMFETF
jgi:hypothetical protein